MRDGRVFDLAVIEQRLEEQEIENYIEMTNCSYPTFAIMDDQEGFEHGNRERGIGLVDEEELMS